MIFTVHTWPPDPNPDGPHEWVAGVEELGDFGVYAEGSTEAAAIGGAQAAALEHLADDLRSGRRAPMDPIESVYFFRFWDLEGVP